MYIGGGFRVRVSINHNKKMIQFWCSTDEKDDIDLAYTMDKIYTIYKNEKYKRIIYYSGSSDITEKTIELLHHNK